MTKRFLIDRVVSAAGDVVVAPEKLTDSLEISEQRYAALVFYIAELIECPVNLANAAHPAVGPVA